MCRPHSRHLPHRRPLPTILTQKRPRTDTHAHANAGRPPAPFRPQGGRPVTGGCPALTCARKPSKLAHARGETMRSTRRESVVPHFGVSRTGSPSAGLEDAQLRSQACHRTKVPRRSSGCRRRCSGPRIALTSQRQSSGRASLALKLVRAGTADPKGQFQTRRISARSAPSLPMGSCVP